MTSAVGSEKSGRRPHSQDGGSRVAAEPLLHDAAETRSILGNAVSEDWLKRKAGLGLIPHTRLGRYAYWSDENIEQLIRENFCDPNNYGRKPRL